MYCFRPILAFEATILSSMERFWAWLKISFASLNDVEIERFNFAELIKPCHASLHLVVLVNFWVTDMKRP
jgi:hypothetical protein